MDDSKITTSEPAPHHQPDVGAATAARMSLSEKAAEVKDKVADLGRTTASNIDDSRKTTAGALNEAAARLHSGADRFPAIAQSAADQISGVAHKTADKLEVAADYVRETDLKAMGEDLKHVVKRHPGPALAVAAVLGFIVARSLRRD